MTDPVARRASIVEIPNAAPNASTLGAAEAVPPSRNGPFQKLGQSIGDVMRDFLSGFTTSVAPSRPGLRVSHGLGGDFRHASLTAVDRVQLISDGGADKADESARKLACPLVLLAGMRPALEEVARSDPDSAPVCQELIAELEALAPQVEEAPPGATQGPFDALQAPFIKGLLAQVADPFSVAPVDAIQRDNKHSVST